MYASAHTCLNCTTALLIKHPAHARMSIRTMTTLHTLSDRICSGRRCSECPYRGEVLPLRDDSRQWRSTASTSGKCDSSPKCQASRRRVGCLCNNSPIISHVTRFVVGRVQLAKAEVQRPAHCPSITASHVHKTLSRCIAAMHTALQLQ